MPKSRPNQDQDAASDGKDPAALDRRLESLVSELRDKVTSLNFEKKAAEQKVAARYTGEIRQLQDTVAAQRARMEEMGFEKQAAVQEVTRTNADQIRQLENTITALREKLREAIREEAYESAARLRDELEKLEESPSPE